MIETEVAVIGGGVAGLVSAIESAKLGANVCLIDENPRPGGQLFKQIHKFFGSQRHYAGTRGFEIGESLMRDAQANGVKTLLNSYVFGIFGKEIGIVEKTGDQTSLRWIQAKSIILSCGASERMMMFPGWTLPGVMGAGAAQTLINVHRVLPGKKFLMIGSGNVGLVVSYQILQAGGEVAALVEALPRIGGWGVHAAKIQRLGVPILTSHTIKEAQGRDRVDSATIVALDKSMRQISGSEQTIDVDVVCIAIGLKPNIELALMAGCETMYLDELGGRVPVHDENMETTVDGVYVVGDCAGVEEASTAIESGRLVGAAVAEKLGHLPKEKAVGMKALNRSVLDDLRSGPLCSHRLRAKEQLVDYAETMKEDSQ